MGHFKYIFAAQKNSIKAILFSSYSVQACEKIHKIHQQLPNLFILIPAMSKKSSNFSLLGYTLLLYFPLEYLAHGSHLLLSFPDVNTLNGRGDKVAFTCSIGIR